MQSDKELPVIFITGNSRSGTTMMMRILDNHSNVHAINEPHFFEKLWSTRDKGQPIGLSEAASLLVKLFTGQRDGFFENPAKHEHKYREEINQLLGNYVNPMTRIDLYSHFLHYESRLNHKMVPCEKTPQNVYYIKEILENFPNARIINMVRDPRAVMLSQKRKWKRRKLGADFITRKEVVRLRINYHPITIGKLWNSAIHAALQFEGDSRVVNLRYEDLLADAQETIVRLSSFLNIKFEPEMLLVPHAGSSRMADQKSELGIRKSKPMGWLEKGLAKSEIQICQKICAANMQKHNYHPIEVNPNPMHLTGQHVTFPFKIALALVFNLKRMRSIVDTIKRRLIK